MKGRHISVASARRARQAAQCWVNFGGAALGPFPNFEAAWNRIGQASGAYRVAVILNRHGNELAVFEGDLEE